MPAGLLQGVLVSGVAHRSELAVEGIDRVHVEHVYPQEPLPGERWSNHSAAINRLGNLTLLGGRLNTAIKNAGLAIKKAQGVRRV
ncbi:MAG TPA: HNH endonuclease family protein [Solirubrobacteraceae bacterium]|jgi:hypothetical protein|nr:HNH endonuclease family protein [Solirubrobacteraceae bacterium]